MSRLWMAVLLLAGTSLYAQEPAKPAEAPKSPSALEDFEAFLKKFKAYGDFRLREENDSRRDDQDDRTRTRIRGRLGANYAVSDAVSVGARLITHEPDTVDPNSPHVTLGRGYDGIEIQFDRAFVEWKGKCEGTWFVRGGKFEHPFKSNPVYGELIWDGDVQPEGAAVVYDLSLGDDWTARVALAEYVAVEQNLLDESSMTGAQVLVNFGKPFVAVDYYAWHHPTADGTTVVSSQNAGNVVSGTEFVSDFEIVHGLVGVPLDLLGEGLPLQTAVEAWKNQEAEGDADFGWAAGVAVGALKEPGDWKLRVQYQVVEQDSVFSVVSGDDIQLQTNFRGALASLTYQLEPAVNLELWAIGVKREHTETTATTDEDPTTLRLRLDLNIKF